MNLKVKVKVRVVHSDPSMYKFNLLRNLGSPLRTYWNIL